MGGACEGDKDTSVGSKYQVPVRMFEELSYWDLTLRLTKGPSNETKKSKCITSRRQIMKGFVATEAKAKPKLGQGETNARPRLGQG